MSPVMAERRLSSKEDAPLARTIMQAECARFYQELEEFEQETIGAVDMQAHLNAIRGLAGRQSEAENLPMSSVRMVKEHLLAARRAFEQARATKDSARSFLDRAGIRGE